MGSWYVFYFMFVVFFGSFYLINLVLAVVAVSYQQEVVAMQERVREVLSGNTVKLVCTIGIMFKWLQVTKRGWVRELNLNIGMISPKLFVVVVSSLPTDTAKGAFTTSVAEMFFI